MKLAVTLSPALIGHNTLSWPVIGCPGLKPRDYWPSMWTFLIVWHFRSVGRVTRDWTSLTCDTWQHPLRPDYITQSWHSQWLWQHQEDQTSSDIMRRSSQSCEIPLLSGGEQIKQWAQQGRRDKRNVLAERSTFLLLTYQWYLVSICLRKTPLLVRSCL